MVCSLRKHWPTRYAYDWANSVYSSVALSGFLSLALQEVALDNSGFPYVRPFRRAPSLGLPQPHFGSYASAWAFPREWYDVLFISFRCLVSSGDPRRVLNDVQTLRPRLLVASKIMDWPIARELVFLLLRSLLPASSGFCYKSDGITPYVLRAVLGAIEVDPDAYVSSFPLVSWRIVQYHHHHLQNPPGHSLHYSRRSGWFWYAWIWRSSHLLVGNFRRCNLFTWILIGSISSLLIPFMNSDTWWLGFFVVLIAYGVATSKNASRNTCFGVSLVFYNSYLPVLADNHPSVIKADCIGCLTRLSLSSGSKERGDQRKDSGWNE